MTDTDFQSEQFQALLAEALRAGPGSPQWHQAVRTLRASNQNVDEFTLLNQAREHLESGKSYRSVQAGPGFTRKLMDGIESGQGRPRGFSLATMIAVAGALVVVIVAAVVVFFSTRTGKPQNHEIDDLAGMVFHHPVLASTFTASDIPSGWQKIGEMPLVETGGLLKPGPFPATNPGTNPSTTPTAEYKTGGIVTAAPIAVDSPLQIEAILHVNRPGDDGIAHLFISDTPIDDQHPRGAHELVWQFQGGQGKVFLPDGRIEGAGDKLKAAADISVKVLLSRGIVVIESDGKRLFAGPSQLSVDQPRYIGLRFIRKAGEKWDHLGFKAITLSKP